MAKTRKIRGSNYVQLATVDGSGEPRVRTVVYRGCVTNLPTDHALYYNVVSCEDHVDPKGEKSDKLLSCVLKMCTDARSHKVQEVQQQQQSTTAEICWWFAKTSEQYRIRGELVFVGNGNNGNNEDDTTVVDATLAQVRKELWGNLSDPARESFLDTSSTPGQPWSSESESNNTSNDDEKKMSIIPKGGRDADGKVLQPPPDNFLLMLLNPHYCDYLCLSGDQYRQIDTLRCKSGNSNGSGWSSQRVNP